INDAPNTEQDYWVARSMLLSAGLIKLDAHKGVHLKPTRPIPYYFHTKESGIIAGLVICIFVMMGVTGARLYLRAFTHRLKWGMDDTLMIPGLIMAVAYPSIQIAVVQYGGAGRHIYDVSYHQITIEDCHVLIILLIQLAAVAQIDFFVCVGIVKMSITVFNIRLTSMASRGWQIGNWIFLSIIICYIIIAFFLNVIQCVPAATSFDLVNYGKRATAPKCMGIREMGTILRAINITMDYLLLATPIIVLWRVQMSWKKKAWLFALSCVGGLACIGSVMTLVAKTHLKSDPLWNYTGILGWSLVELVFSVLAASLPTLAFLLLPTSIRTNQCEASEPYPSQPSQRR
ncbi:hypothetical protein K432DRAFT_291469, partial [Lepidopterella palustris CBS 459.81]